MNRLVRYFVEACLAGALVLPMVYRSLERPLTYKEKARSIAADVIKNGYVTHESEYPLFPNLVGKIPGAEWFKKTSRIMRKSYQINGEGIPKSDIIVDVVSNMTGLSLKDGTGFEGFDHDVDGNLDAAHLRSLTEEAGKEKYRSFLDKLTQR